MLVLPDAVDDAAVVVSDDVDDMDVADAALPEPDVADVSDDVNTVDVSDEIDIDEGAAVMAQPAVSAQMSTTKAPKTFSLRFRSIV